LLHIDAFYNEEIKGYNRKEELFVKRDISMAFDWDDYYSNCTVQYVG
jgi:hypothetical protein